MPQRFFFFLFFFPSQALAAEFACAALESATQPIVQTPEHLSALVIFAQFADEGASATAPPLGKRSFRRRVARQLCPLLPRDVGWTALRRWSSVASALSLS